MQSVKLMMRPAFGALACALALTAAIAPAAHAAPMRSEAVATHVVHVPKDKSLSYRLTGPASRIVVSQTDVAQVVATSDRSFYVRGKDFGSTNLLVYDTNGRLWQVIDVRVGFDAAAVQHDLAAVFPGEDIRVRSLGERLLLLGQVSNTGVAARAFKLAEKYAPGAVTSNLTVRSSQEVVLEVRILEASRTVLRDIGVSARISNNSFTFATGNGLIGADAPQGILALTGGSGATTIDVLLEALESKGLVRTLARPNLVAISGERANFLAGGEFPFPVPAGRDNVTIEFRPFGVKLDFLPIVQDNGLIRLEVEPEVSALDPRNSLRLASITVPALTTRKLKTTVELKSGEALAIGGLFQREYANSIAQVPGLGSIPILGALFRSTQWRRNETELLIVVTPKLATAADFAAAKQANISGKEPSASELLLLGKSLDKPFTGPKETK